MTENLCPRCGLPIRPIASDDSCRCARDGSAQLVRASTSENWGLHLILGVWVIGIVAFAGFFTFQLSRENAQSGGGIWVALDQISLSLTHSWPALFAVWIPGLILGTAGIRSIPKRIGVIVLYLAGFVSIPCFAVWVMCSNQ